MKKISYGKFAKWACIIIIAVVFFKLCSKDEEKASVFIPLEQTFSSIKGYSFIDEKSFKNDTCRILYFKNYSDYKIKNIDSKLEKSDFDNYWGSEENTEKYLIKSVLKIFEEQPKTKFIDIQKNNYHLKISKNSFDQLEYFFSTQKPEFGNNNEERFVQNENGRKLFIQTFSK